MSLLVFFLCRCLLTGWNICPQSLLFKSAACKIIFNNLWFKINYLNLFFFYYYFITVVSEIMESGIYFLYLWKNILNTLITVPFHDHTVQLKILFFLSFSNMSPKKWPPFNFRYANFFCFTEVHTCTEFQLNRSCKSEGQIEFRNPKNMEANMFIPTDKHHCT